MQLISDILDLREIRRTWQSSAKVIAFVPTMGNLHQGHLNLVREAKKQADIVVVSIFVNPMQFGPDEDLDAYPRTLQSDSRLLEELGVDVLFMPKATDIYARGLEQQTFVEVPGLSYMICGASRPGHFRGVATIVCKLFNMVQPNLAFFGEKDFQQLQVIKAMVTDLSMNLKVFGMATTRDDDGLAMSSRNQYLKDKERKLAPSLYEKMQQLASEIQLGRRDFSKITQEYKLQLAELGFNPDYLEIRNVENLLQPGHEDQHLVLLAAAFLGKTRLIDNLQIRLV
ncbi:pantoate--beta-alanine ligase [uncultured Paraglaciecola sp.]|jgi:pantoate--beta-alanine ligase|uniref:pantoate--beta-alanine ligase n=1 Tax=uncultured Paraglaciecola sp. TaxID=1765024 RepID=UPI002623C61B|nr:pantoate--beta-alanine ligase [uncultured Paraglaciecola sp.]|tara:strand:- start:5204 stop:6055 length:852 start_codon:yes stop_codon:yes gene_type:complete